MEEYHPFSPPPFLSPMRTYSLQEAAALCGWRRKNTFRVRFLVGSGRADLVIGLGPYGELRLDADRVDELVRQLENEREAKGNWRAANLGHWARPRGFTENGDEG
jgi:hypothetical protein